MFKKALYLSLILSAGLTPSLSQAALPTIQLIGPAVVVNEGQFSEVRIPVERKGDDASKEIFVGYKTSDGTAVQPEDYTQTVGHIFWRPGDRSPGKELIVPIIDDNLPEREQFFTVKVLNIQNAILIGPDTVKVVLGSNDPLPGDTNNDCVVDIEDLNRVKNEFGKTGTGLKGDLDKSGKVDTNDLNLVRNNMGKVCQ